MPAVGSIEFEKVGVEDVEFDVREANAPWNTSGFGLAIGGSAKNDHKKILSKAKSKSKAAYAPPSISPPAPALPPRLHHLQFLQKHHHRQQPQRSATLPTPAPSPSPSPPASACSDPVELKFELELEEPTPTNTESPTSFPPVVPTRPRSVSPIASMFATAPFLQYISLDSSLASTWSMNRPPSRSFSPALDPVLRRLQRARMSPSPSLSPVPTPDSELAMMVNEAGRLSAFVKTRSRVLRVSGRLSSFIYPGSRSSFSVLFFLVSRFPSGKYGRILLFHLMRSAFSVFQKMNRRVSMREGGFPFHCGYRLWPRVAHVPTSGARSRSRVDNIAGNEFNGLKLAFHSFISMRSCLLLKPWLWLSATQRGRSARQ